MKDKAASTQRKILVALGLLIVIILIGTFGYMFIERYTFIEALYMTFITVSTVGFKEVHPLSDGGRIFTILLIISSLGIVAYSFTALASQIIEGELRQLILGRIKRTGLKKMKKHVIICGYGRNGRQAGLELRAHGTPFVVIDNKREHMTDPSDSSVIFIEGDATEDGVLTQAGVEKAYALITSLPNDADNLFVAISARTLNPKILIISRAASENAERKLKMAGVNNVVLPEKVGGGHMASLVVHPDVIEFLDHISVHGKDANNLEEITCDHIGKAFLNKSIQELDIRIKTGANIIGYKDPEGSFVINPPPDTQLICNSKIFVLGTPAQITKMKELLQSDQ